MTTTISPREEVILSYLVGLAPLGEEIYVDRQHTIADCELKRDVYLTRDLRSLHVAGAIEIIERGYQKKPTVLKVLQRPEVFKVVDAMKGRYFVVREAFSDAGTRTVEDYDWAPKDQWLQIRVTKQVKNRVHTLAFRKQKSITDTIIELVDKEFA